MYFVGIVQCFELQCRCCINFLGFFLGGGVFFPLYFFFPCGKIAFALVCITGRLGIVHGRFYLLQYMKHSSAFGVCFGCVPGILLAVIGVGCCSVWTVAWITCTALWRKCRILSRNCSLLTAQFTPLMWNRLVLSSSSYSLAEFSIPCDAHRWRISGDVLSVNA